MGEFMKTGSAYQQIELDSGGAAEGDGDRAAANDDLLLAERSEP